MSDPRAAAIPVAECGERLVDVRGALLVDDHRAGFVGEFRERLSFSGENARFHGRVMSLSVENTSVLASGPWLCSARRGARVLPNSKVDLYAAIRRDARTGMAMRALMRKYGVGYKTVQRALTSALPGSRKKMRPQATRWTPVSR